MKKKILSLLLALLLLTALMPTAFAVNDESYYLGSYGVGQEINCYITDIPLGSFIGAVIPPDGCRLELEDGYNVSKLYLRGSIRTPGLAIFTLEVEGYESYSITCSLEVSVAAPIVSASADINCKFGDTAVISVSARSTDGGELGYQWFSVTNGMIPGANQSSYRPNTMLVGTEKYYCAVVSSGGGTATSSVISVTVSGAQTAESISVVSMPDKVKYNIGEVFNPKGLLLNVKYSDGTTRLVNTGYEVAPRFLNTAGKQTIEVSFEGASCTFDVLVGLTSDLVSRIEVYEKPDKTLYKVGDKFDPTGLVVCAYLYDNSVQYITEEELEYSPEDLKTAGTQAITVRFAERTCTFNVTVEDDKTEVKIVSPPYKVNYTVGDKLDTTGLVISIQNGSRTETVTTGFSYTPKVLTTAGTQEITVIYGGVNKAVFNVTVNEKPGTSPTPAPSASVVTPKPTDSIPVTVTPAPTAIRHESHTTSFAGTLMKVILVIAIFSLVGLGAYVYTMRKKGKM